MSLKTKAAELRKIALELETKADDAPRSAEAVMRRYAPPASHMRIEVPLLHLGHSNYDARKHMTNQAGHQLGRHIADQLEFELERAKEPYKSAPPFAFQPVEYYEAVVYALTPGQLRDLVSKAFDAGQNCQ